MVINYNFFDYLPNEFTSGSGTNIEATIQHIKAAKMIASVFVILRRKAFFIKNNFRFNVLFFSLFKALVNNRPVTVLPV